MTQSRATRIVCNLLLTAASLVVVQSASAEDKHAIVPKYSRPGKFYCVSPFAVPSNTRYYGGYYVGGGSLVGGDGRGPQDGTWGWDYGGIAVKKLVNLDWTHGRRYQGGTGQYNSAGPAAFRSQ
jgi:hypothetical protein